jgi:hypothetical protein
MLECAGHERCPIDTQGQAAFGAFSASATSTARGSSDAFQKSAAIERAIGTSRHEHDGASVRNTRHHRDEITVGCDACGDGSHEVEGCIVDDANDRGARGSALEVGGDGCCNADANAAKRFARVGKFTAEFVEARGNIARAARKLARKRSRDGCFATNVAPGTRTRRKNDANISLVTFDGFDSDKPHLGRVRAMRPAARRYVEVPNRHDAYVVRHFRLTPQRERAKFIGGREEGPNGDVVIDERVDEILGLGDRAFVECGDIEVDGAGAFSEAGGDGFRGGNVRERPGKHVLPGVLRHVDTSPDLVDKPVDKLTDGRKRAVEQMMNASNIVNHDIDDARFAKSSTIGHLATRFGIKRGAIEEHTGFVAERSVFDDACAKGEKQRIVMVQLDGTGSGHGAAVSPTG